MRACHSLDPDTGHTATQNEARILLSDSKGLVYHFVHIGVNIRYVQSWNIKSKILFLMAWAGYHLEIWSASWPLSLKVTCGDWISTLGRAPHLLGAGTPALILPSGSERSKICKLTNACEVCQRRWLEKSLLVQLWKDSVLANTSKNKWISERYFSEDPWGRHRKMIKKKKQNEWVLPRDRCYSKSFHASTHTPTHVHVFCARTSQGASFNTHISQLGSPRNWLMGTQLTMQGQDPDQLPGCNFTAHISPLPHS